MKKIVLLVCLVLAACSLAGCEFAPSKESKTTTEEVSVELKPCYEITLEDGTTISFKSEEAFMDYMNYLANQQ